MKYKVCLHLFSVSNGGQNKSFMKLSLHLVNLHSKTFFSRVQKQALVILLLPLRVRILNKPLT